MLPCFVVAGIAVTHVAATQAARYAVVERGVPPFFSMWFSTNWNVLLALPLARTPPRRITAGVLSSPRRLVWIVCPFFGLWACANTLYVSSLTHISSSLTTALFGVTPALVVLLAVPVLRRRLTLVSCLACLLSAVGVTLIAQPWDQQSSAAPLAPSAPPPSPYESSSLPPPSLAASPEASLHPSPLLGLVTALGAAGCAASYKVLFKRVFGDAPPRFVLLMLSALGGWSLVVGTAILLAVTAAAPGGLAAAAAALPSLPWGMLCAKSILDLGFNYLIAFGIALTHPLFISIGTVLGTPLNVLVEWALRGTTPAPWQGGGVAVITLAFALLLGEEAARPRGSAVPLGCGVASTRTDQQPDTPPEAARRWARLQDSGGSGGGLGQGQGGGEAAEGDEGRDKRCTTAESASVE